MRNGNIPVPLDAESESDEISLKRISSMKDSEAELGDNGSANVDVDADVDVDVDSNQLQQLKAKKNRSNLFLIKSYSFMESNNNNNNDNNNSRSNKNKAAATAAELLQSPDLQPFSNIECLLLAQAASEEAEAETATPRSSKKQKKPKKSKKKKGSKDELDGGGLDLDVDVRLLRRQPPAVIHEYEEIQREQATTLPRPQSLPAKVHFEAAADELGLAMAAEASVRPAKRSSAHIKRESFIRQSLQSIRRSFGSSKQPSKATTATVAPQSSSIASSGGSTASSCSSSSSSTAIALLSQATAHQRRLDEFVATPIVLLLNDDDLGEISDDSVGKRKRSASSVATLANGQPAVSAGQLDERATTSGSMAPLQPSSAAAAADGHSASPAAATTATAAALNEQQQQQRRQQYCQQLSLPETSPAEAGGGASKDKDKDKDRSLRHSYSSSLSPLQNGDGDAGVGGSALSLASSSLSQSGSSGSAAGSGGHGSANTAKQHDQQTSAVAAISSTSAAAGVASASASSTSTPAAAAATGTAAAVPEKEKKRKEVSSSRVKKFHRHFSQVSKDEKLINYFSCALVSDILLQGHLYITDQHFAFYSNVFGYVTKVVIPTSSVTKISKEKTAKIIPNAVGVATADERHVFGSFISRESAYRLMLNVCSQLAPSVEILCPKVSPADMEISEEYFIEDDSSCSISGNESPPQPIDGAMASSAAAEQQAAATSAATLRQRHQPARHSDLPPKNATAASLGLGLGVAHAQIGLRSSAPPGVHYEAPLSTATSTALPSVLIVAGSQSSSSTSASSASASNSANVSAASSGPSSSSSPITVVGMGVASSSPAAQFPAQPAGHSSASASASSSLMGRLRAFGQSARTRLPLPSELHVLYLGVLLAVLLALFSVFLLYRILDIEAKTSLYNTPVDFNWRSGNDEDIFAEALRWQKELQAKSTEEAQLILSKNLEQISKVRRSLETLSMLIHDRRAAYGQSAGGAADQDLDLDQVQHSVLSSQRNRDDSD